MILIFVATVVETRGQGQRVSFRVFLLVTLRKGALQTSAQVNLGKSDWHPAASPTTQHGQSASFVSTIPSCDLQHSGTLVPW